MTKPTLTARTPEDLVALVPCLLGFHPQDSIVMMTFGAGPRAFQARVDLPETRSDIDEVVDLLVPPAMQHGVRQTVLVAYSPATELGAATLLRLERALEDAGVAVLEMLRVDGDRWFGVRPEVTSLVPDGVPFDLAQHPFTAQWVYEGRVIHGSRSELADSLIGSDPELVEQVEEEAFRHVTGWHEVQLPAEARWVRDLVAGHVARRTVPGPGELGRLLVAIRVEPVREAVWSLLDGDVARDHVEFWGEVVRRTPTTFLAPAAGSLAVAAWLAGNGALAWCAVDRALLADPDDELAQLVSGLLTSAMPPHAWKPPRAPLDQAEGA